MLMETMDRSNTNNWVDGFIDNLQQVIDNGGQVPLRDNSGEEILIVIRSDMLSFLVANRVRLAQVTIDAFKEFLKLMSKGQSFEALVIIYERIDNASLVDKYKEDTIKLAEIAKETQENRDFWISFGRQAVEKLVFSALGALL